MHCVRQVYRDSSAARATGSRAAFPSQMTRLTELGKQ